MDSAELSFVRCPACRSLVPAASNRCRMCGSSLEGLTQSESSAKEEPKNGRVRQHTSVDDPGISEAIEKVRTEQAAVESPAPAVVTPSPVESKSATASPTDEEDPLKAYLEDFEEDEDDEDDLEDLLSDDDDDDDEADEHKKPVEAAKKPELPVEQPKVVVEQGGQRKSGGLSFGSKGEASKPKPENKPVQQASKPAPQAASPKQTAKPQQQSAPKPQAQKQKRDHEQLNESGTPGQLFGWFVSFASPEGASLEIREGRFFITNTSVRRGDLVLHDDSVSSPHALVTISSGTGLTIQDLMSEFGLFIKRAGEDSFYQERETAELFHGDSVRFGNVEFLVCLVPNGNA